MLLADMSRRELRLGRRKKSLERQKPKVLTVSIPHAAVSVQQHPGLFCSPSLSNALQHSVHIDQPVSQLTVYEWPSDIYDFALTPLSILKLPPQWVIPSMTPLCLCKVGLQEVCRPSVTLSIASLEWTTTISSKTLNPSTSPVLFNLPCIPCQSSRGCMSLNLWSFWARQGFVEFWLGGTMEELGSSSLLISSGMLHKYWCS